MSAASTVERGVFALLVVAAVCQALTTWDSFYLATDDWLIVTYGREPLALDDLLARQTAGTPAIRPVSLSLARLQHLAFGDAATPRIIWHLVLHAFTAYVVWLLLSGLAARYRIPQGAQAAVFGAAVFYVWPLHGEALAWFHSGHTTIPMACLTLLAITAWVRRWPVLAQVGFALAAVLTRENAVMLAPTVVLLAWSEGQGGTWWQRALGALRHTAAPVGVVGIYVVLRAIQVVIALQGDQLAELPVGQSAWRTLGYLLFHFSIPVHPGVEGALLWLVGSIGIALFWLVRAPSQPRVFALGWLLLFCLPFAPLYDTGDPLFTLDQSGYERRWYHLYLPTVGLAAGLGAALARTPKVWAPVLVFILALQTLNADWYAGLGRSLRVSFAEVEALVATGRPLVFTFEDEPTLMGDLVQHQVVDIPRVFPDHSAPVYRRKPSDEGRGFVRATADDFGYPTFLNLPASFVPPPDAIWRHYDGESTGFSPPGGM